MLARINHGKVRAMSRYATILTEFKDSDALLVAIAETGDWTIEQIEVHDVPQHLFGYTGDKRQEMAHIIVRRKHVGSSSNDIGFVKTEDGTYEAIISEYDSRKFGPAWNKQLKCNYAYEKIRKDMTQRGRRVSRFREANGTQRIVVTGYR